MNLTRTDNNQPIAIAWNNVTYVSDEATDGGGCTIHLLDSTAVEVQQPFTDVAAVMRRHITPIVGPRGPRGHQGERGDPGPQGPTGEPGRDA